MVRIHLQDLSLFLEFHRVSAAARAQGHHGGALQHGGGVSHTSSGRSSQSKFPPQPEIVLNGFDRFSFVCQSNHLGTDTTGDNNFLVVVNKFNSHFFTHVEIRKTKC